MDWKASQEKDQGKDLPAELSGLVADFHCHGIPQRLMGNTMSMARHWENTLTLHVAAMGMSDS